jgi:hypothetical protein
MADHLGQGNRDVATARTHIDATPPRSDPESLQGGGQRAAVDVVSKAF